MNLQDPLVSKTQASGSVHATSNEMIPANKIDSSLNSPPLFRSNETEAIIKAVTESGAHLWSFKDYWIITLPVVAATIFLPIIIGPVFRFTVRKLLRNTAFIVPILMLLTIVASLATSLKDKFTAYTVVILFPFGLTAVALMFYVPITGTDQILWCGFATTYGTSLWIDTFVRDFRIIGTPKGPWVSDLLPPVYLLVTHCGIGNWDHVGLRMKVLLWKWFGMVKGAEGAKRERYRAAVMVLYHGIAIAYWYNVRDRGTLLATPFAILAANRLLNTINDSGPKRFFIWVGFLIVWIISVVVDRGMAPSRASGFFIAFFPMWALFGYWAYLDHKTRIHEILRGHWAGQKKQGKTKSASDGSDFLPAHSRRQTFDAPRAPFPARSRRQASGVSSARHSTD